MWTKLLLILSYALSIAGVARGNETVSCFHHRENPSGPDPGPVLVPTTFHDCYQVAKFILRPSRSDLPILFSRYPGRGYQVPDTWGWGSCAIRLDTHSWLDEDTATFMDIVREVNTVLLGCVARPPHFGGTQFVGPRRKMNVTVMGHNGPRTLEKPHLPFSDLIRNVSAQGDLSQH